MQTTPTSTGFLRMVDVSRNILKRYEKRCEIDVDSDTEYYLN